MPQGLGSALASAVAARQLPREAGGEPSDARVETPPPLASAPAVASRIQIGGGGLLEAILAKSKGLRSASERVLKAKLVETGMTAEMKAAMAIRQATVHSAEKSKKGEDVHASEWITSPS